MENVIVICINGIFYIGAPLLLGVGIYYVALAIRNPKLADASKEWPTVDGLIQQNQLIGKPGFMNNLELRYDYVYNGEKYTGKNFTLFPNTIFGKEDTNELIEKYQPGQKALVYINPNNPKQSVLDTDIHKLPLYFGVWGGINIVVGGILAVILISGLMNWF